MVKKTRQRHLRLSKTKKQRGGTKPNMSALHAALASRGTSGVPGLAVPILSSSSASAAPTGISSVFSAPRPSVANVPKPKFTMGQLRDLKEYVDRPEIVIRVLSINGDPKEIYPEITDEEIMTIKEQFSKPVVSAASASIVAPPKMSLKEEIEARGKKLTPNVSKTFNATSYSKQFDITPYTKFTPDEESILNEIDSIKRSLALIDADQLKAAKKSIVDTKEKGQRIKDFQLIKVLELMKEKQTSSDRLSKLMTPEIQAKKAFVNGTSNVLHLNKDKDGTPLDDNVFLVVKRHSKMGNSEEKGVIFYINTNTGISSWEKPIKEWIRGEENGRVYYANKNTIGTRWETRRNKPADDNSGDVWYVDTITGEPVWEKPPNITNANFT